MTKVSATAKWLVRMSTRPDKNLPATRWSRQSSCQARPSRAKQRCNHPLALVVDQTERELRELEVLLSNRPNCSRCTPENGPIMAVLSSAESQDHKAPEDFT